MDKRKMPSQKPGNSEQTVGTPWDFIKAIECRWGTLGIDLASTDELAKAPKYFTPKDDSLQQNWYGHGLAYLNPPFGEIGLWASKCASQVQFLKDGELIFLLVPASIGSHWYWDHVHGKSNVLALSPRITFIGHKHCYPKDLILAVYGEPPGFSRWTWKKSVGGLSIK